MRYGLRVELPGVTQEQYDGLHAQLGSIAGESPGLLAHIAGPMDGGWYVTEVWASKADCERFMAKAMPAMTAAPTMNIQEFEVYNCETKEQIPV